MAYYGGISAGSEVKPGQVVDGAVRRNEMTRSSEVRPMGSDVSLTSVMRDISSRTVPAPVASVEAGPRGFGRIAAFEEHAVAPVERAAPVMAREGVVQRGPGKAVVKTLSASVEDVSRSDDGASLTRNRSWQPSVERAPVMDVPRKERHFELSREDRVAMAERALGIGHGVSRQDEGALERG